LPSEDPLFPRPGAEVARKPKVYPWGCRLTVPYGTVFRGGLFQALRAVSSSLPPSCFVVVVLRPPFFGKAGDQAPPRKQNSRTKDEDELAPVQCGSERYVGFAASCHRINRFFELPYTSAAFTAALQLGIFPKELLFKIPNRGAKIRLDAVR
jgi:hypothetical protein